MKLSPAKVDQLSDNLLDYLMEVEGVLFQGTDGELLHALREIMTDELMIEERLDARVHKMLQAYKYEITTQRLKYDELFRKMRQQLIKDEDIVL
ncbi:MAG: DUF507 family protein [Chloroflexaceae bacterium]|nr:DUF507 family protein [Chloroflexaceae bacterium]NJL32927.1 DUF507 family protein [Chloroflexaceae bacterium]NJO06073.1 DUF507 family protein [Chloroflexaceae bacterium]